MSWDFTKVRTVSGRKEHQCIQCQMPIAAGDKHFYFAGKFDGDFMDYREHLDCREAWLAHAVHVGHEDDGDGLPFFRDDYNRDDAWIWENYPAIAERLGLAKPPVAET